MGDVCSGSVTRPSSQQTLSTPAYPATFNPLLLECVQAVGDVCFGSVMGPSSQRANECRIAMFLAGFPASVPVHTVNRCAAMPCHAMHNLNRKA